MAEFESYLKYFKILIYFYNVGTITITTIILNVYIICNNNYRNTHIYVM